MNPNSSQIQAFIQPIQPPIAKAVINPSKAINISIDPPKKAGKKESAVVLAVRHLMNPKGSSIADIKKYLISEHKSGGSDPKGIKLQLQNALKRGILSEAGGKFKLNQAARRRRSSGRKRSRSRRRGRSKSGGKRRRSRRKRSTGGRKRRSGSRRKRRSRRSGSRKSRRSRRRTRRHKSHPGHVPGDEYDG